VHDQVSQMIQNGVQAIYTLNENEGLNQALRIMESLDYADYNYKDKLKTVQNQLVML
jgi:hypothetical protein